MFNFICWSAIARFCCAVLYARFFLRPQRVFHRENSFYHHLSLGWQDVSDVTDSHWNRNVTRTQQGQYRQTNVGHDTSSPVQESLVSLLSAKWQATFVSLCIRIWICWSQKHFPLVNRLVPQAHTDNTHLLTPQSRVLLENLTNFQIVKEFHTFYGTWRFITAFTSACHLSLSWASSIQSIPPHSTPWRSILILFSHLRLGLPSSLFP